MSKAIRVVVEGGGKNLYYIRGRSGEFEVYHHRVNLVWDNENLVGVAGDIEEALEMIEEHSGEKVDSYEVEED
jgi:hypothetical protein